MRRQCQQLVGAAVAFGAFLSAVNAEPVPDEQVESGVPAFHLSAGGSGDLQFAYHDYGPDQTREGGAQAENRLVFDMTRFVLELEGEWGYGLSFEAEVEFEHGGTGGALELEYEEFGEYENEVEKGGEVLVEELYLQKKFGDSFALKIGQFNVALGLLYSHHGPLDYLGSSRPESETRVIPAVWTELGLGAVLETEWVKATAQVVSGLDSTGFSSQRWIASGHQTRFELKRATGLAGVARVDIVGVDGLVFGVSGYAGADTNDNRPKPDLDDVSSPVVLASAHAAADLAPVRARVSGVWGHLWEAEQISETNRRLSNNLDVLRSPVAEEAVSLWGEVGVDLFHFIRSISQAHRLELFTRVEYLDTMFSVSEQTFDNPRFERMLFGGGLGYAFHDIATAKLDLTHRQLGSSDFRPENTVRLSTAFQF